MSPISPNFTGLHMVALPFMSNADQRLHGAVYASLTQENPTTQFTVGAGTGNAMFIDLEDNLFGVYLGLKSGPNRVKFLAEYWQLWVKSGRRYEAVPNLFLGGRFVATNISVDFGLLYPNTFWWIGSVAPIGIPAVNFVYTF